MLCSCAVVGFAAKLLHTAVSTSSQGKVLRGRETEVSNSGVCKQDPVPHPSQEISGRGKTESEWCIAQCLALLTTAC